MNSGKSPARMRARLGGVVEERRRAALLAPRGPAAAPHEVRVEDVGADEPRVVRLEPPLPARVGARQDPAREQHADRLAADEPGADHPAPDGEEVREIEPAAREDGEPLVPGQHHPEQVVEVRARLRGGRRVGADRVERVARLLELPVPQVVAGDRVEPPVGELGEHLGEDAALGERPERVALLDVRQVHRGRVAGEHLERVHVALPLAREDVDEELRRVPDRVDGLVGVAVAQHREVGDGVELVEVRAGHHEEVAEHEVRVPVGGEVREAVEHVVGAAPGLGDDAVDRGGEALEAERRREPVDLGALARLDERRVAREAEVDEPLARRARPRDERRDERDVLVDRVDLPDDVVAGEEPADHGVEGGEPGAGRVRRHALASSTPRSGVRAARRARRRGGAAGRPLRDGRRTPPRD